MQNFNERAVEVVCCSTVALQVFLSEDNAHMAVRQMKPNVESYIDTRIIEAQQLRSVGIVGLHGLTQVCAFEEDLPDNVTAAIAMAFETYLKAFLGADYAERQTRCEVAELDRIFALPDNRR